MTDPLLWHRIQFGFTITYHYLFPQLTMGLALLIVWFKWKALRTADPAWAEAARFWIRVFGINFAVGVVTGIPMEFQFGTNWARFSADVSTPGEPLPASTRACFTQWRTAVSMRLRSREP
jgi:cytochrome bd ubiquinol oxidase subunit I